MESGEVLKSRYKVERSLGLASGRQKFLGQDLTSGKQVVVETLHDTVLNDDMALSSLKYEIELSSKLNGPYFADYIDSFTHSGQLVIVWKYVDGQPISNNKSLKELTPRDVCIFIALCVSAIKTAHEKGVIHGALSSDSILITPQLEPVIIGFSTPGHAPVTDPGTLNGVSAYACAAPELFQGEPIDESCDYYAIGIIAKFLFSLVDKEDQKNAQKHYKASVSDTLSSTEVDHARALIAGLLSTQRSFRIQSAERLTDSSFLDSMSTPPGGNEVIKISKKQRRQIKKNLKAPRPPRGDQTQILINVGLRALAIASVAITLIIIIAKATSGN